MNVAHKGSNSAGNKYFYVVLFDDTIPGSIAITDVGIDRYLSDSARSSGHTYEVQSGATTFVADVGQCLVAK